MAGGRMASAGRWWDAGMRQLLKPHPDSHSGPATRIDVDITQRVDSVQLSYIVAGRMDEIRIPSVTAAARVAELWQHTCFEAFFRASSDDEYYEFNFSPSTQWAAYRFSSYRGGMQVATEIGAPPIEVRSGPGSFVLKTVVEFGSLWRLSRKVSWRLGLSALIEDTSGHKSHWALAHPPGRPDFHHAACFALEFSPTVQP